MASNFVRDSDNNLWCYYISGNTLYERVYSNDVWQSPQRIIDNVRNNFSISIAQNKDIYIFTQDTSENILLHVKSKGVFNTRTIFQNHNKTSTSVHFQCIVTDTSFTLVYALRSTQKHQYTLMKQTLSNDGNWSQPELIDNIYSTSETPYTLQKISDNHFTLFYNQYINNSLALGYREITPTAKSNFIQIHNTNYQVIDSSFLTTDFSINLAYIVKSNFSSQLIYRTKNDKGLCDAILIAEGQRIRNVLQFYANNKLHIMYTLNDVLFYVVSHDFGNTFAKPVRLKKGVSAPVSKSHFHTTQKQNCATSFFNNVYTFDSAPYSISLIQTVYNNFYDNGAYVNPTTHSTPDIIPKKDNTSNDKLLEQYNILKDKYYLSTIKIRELEQNNAKNNNDLDRQTNYAKQLELRNKALHDEIKILKLKLNNLNTANLKKTITLQEEDTNEED